MRDHRYFEELVGRESDEVLWQWIEARESDARPWRFYYGWAYDSLPRLYDYSTASNIYCYLLSALGWAAKEVMGLKGLLLVFDEAETVEMYYYSYQAERSRNFLRALIRTANDDPVLLEEPYRSDLIYCKVGIGQHIPFLYKPVSGLKLIFAFTFLDHMLYILVPEIEHQPRVTLNPLSEEALKQVFEHICLLYDSAYDYLEEDATIDAIFRELNRRAQTPRRFVKGAVEVLDLARLSPGWLWMG